MVAKLLLALIAAAALLPAQIVKVRLAGGQIRRVSMEDYIAWVLAGEAGGMKSPEALKAMAVVARTFARFNLSRHDAQGFNFCETTHCQDARPGAVSPRIRAAVDDTQGIILWYRGRPASVYYTGHCGGRTAGAGEIWPGTARPYLQSVEDPFCLRAGPADWKAHLAWPQLAEILARPAIEHLEVARSTPSGRVAELRTNAGPVGAERLHLLTGRRLGWNLLRSRLYEVAESAEGALFRGRGTGHGVGFCQTGAEQRGLAGHLWPQIVEAYLPGLRAGVSAKDIPWRVLQGERVEVWSASAPADDELPHLADLALAEAEKRTGLRAGKRPQLRAYPDVSVFRDATGEPGSVAASTRGRVVHLQPTRILRAAGTFTNTLLHEMIHVLIALNAKAPVPLWLDEGLADYLGGGSTHPAERRRVAALVKQKGLPAVLSSITAGAAIP
jgi:stage II sporulation protein D